MKNTEVSVAEGSSVTVGKTRDEISGGVSNELHRVSGTGSQE